MEIYRQTSDSITLAIYVDGELRNADISGITHLVYVTITRLSDNLVVVNNANATNIGIGRYEYVLTTSLTDIIGDYKAVWSFTIDGGVNTKTDYFTVVIPYTTASELKDMFPELSSKNNEDIYRKEKIARRIINSFCSQSFDFEETTKIIKGNNKNKLLLPKRLYKLTSVKIDGADDITADVDVEDFFWIVPLAVAAPPGLIDTKKGITEPGAYFRPSLKYHIKGEWGWEFVPEEVQQACRLLISDYFDDDYLLRQHGVRDAQMGDRRLVFKGDLWESTGNYDVDILLSGFKRMNIAVI